MVQTKVPNLTSFLKVLILALILSVGVSYATASSGAPAGGPPNCPTSNDACNAPIHVGTNEQTKTGRLNVSNAIWGDFLASKGNAYVNDRLGIALGAPGGVANPPTANLDVAGTVRFRGDVNSVPAANKVLTAIDSQGNVAWRDSTTMAASGYVAQSGWWWFDPNASTISSCFSRCIIPITFTDPFPADVIPVVTAQPQWITYTNFGSNNISGASTWGVTNITNTGFDFIYHSTYNNTYGDTGLLWTATYKPGSNTVSDITCRATYSYSGTNRIINWLLSTPTGVKRGFPLTIVRSNGTKMSLPSNGIPNQDWLIESITEPRSTTGTVTKTFKVTDRNGGLANPSCSHDRV